MSSFLGQDFLNVLKVVLVTLERLVVIANVSVVEDKLAQVAAAHGRKTVRVHFEVIKTVAEKVVLRDPVEIDELNVQVDTLISVLGVARLFPCGAGFITRRGFIGELDPVLGQ